MMRVKLVIVSNNAGRNDSEVSSSMVWTLSDQVWPPPGPGVLVMPGKPCAMARAGASVSNSTASRLRRCSGIEKGRMVTIVNAGFNYFARRLLPSASCSF